MLTVELDMACTALLATIICVNVLTVEFDLDVLRCAILVVTWPLMCTQDKASSRFS